MRHRLFPLALAVLCGAVPLPAQQDSAAARDSLRQRIEQLQREIDALRAASDRQNQRLMELDERASGGGAPSAAQDTGRRSLPSARGIYGKPFVKRFGAAGTAIGGYVDMEYRNEIDAHESAFDQHRLIPFIFSEITDRLHFGTEIEFEHAPKIEVENGEATGAGEVRVEFATLDYRFTEGLNLRAGLVLSPLGRFNLVHDSPVNDLTDRPLVDRFIIPTTLSETGAGLFGTVYPTEQSLLSYEAYVVNGFTARVLSDDGLRLGEGTGSSEDDNNFAKSVVGRVALSPFLGLELGASAHTGRYARANGPFTGGENLTVWALDGAFQRGPVDVIGELARASIDLPAAIRAEGFADRQSGYYVQANYHFGHGWVPPKATSVFTGVARWDRIDLDAGRDGDLRERLTLGLNWRPVGDAVLKSDFQWNWTTVPGATRRDPVDRRLLMSVATYF